MSRYVLSVIQQQQQQPKPIGDYAFKAQAVMEMHKAARAHIVALLEKKYASLLPKPLQLRFDLRKVPVIQYAQIVSKKDGGKTLSTEKKDDGMTTLSDARIAGEYALVYTNDDATWLDVVRVHEQVPSWWQWGGRVVAFETLCSFAVQATTAMRRFAPPGSDPKAYASWCNRRDQVIADLNKTLAEKAKDKRASLSASVLRFEWDE